MDARMLERVLLGFVSGVSVLATYLLLVACHEYLYNQDINVFFYHALAHPGDANAVYEAWYAVLSITILLLFKWRFFFKGRNRYLKIALIIFQVIFFLLLSSRLLILVFTLLLIPYYIKKIFTGNIYGKRIRVAILVVIPVVLSLLIFTNNPIKSRYENFFTRSYSLAWLDDYTGVSEGDFSNFTLRIFLWRMGFENIKEHQLWIKGAGNGDVSTLQNQKIAEHHFKNMEPGQVNRSPFYNVNLHNMFLQTFMAIGILGLICFCIASLSPFFYLQAITNSIVFFIFFFASFFFMMQEAALQTQAGVVYYLFFSCIFWAHLYTSKVNKSLSKY
jgi:O-antigen ligase